jgi:hypothetical protein
VNRGARKEAVNLCQEASIDNWNPNFSSSGQSNPNWFRLTCSTRVVANALNWSDWAENPVQVILCDACGHVGCASGGYIHVSSLGDYVLWSAPQEDWVNDPAAHFEPASFLKTFGAVAFRSEQWNEWRARVQSLPEADRFERSNGRALADAWVLGPGRPLDLNELLPMLEARLLGGDTLERDQILETIRSFLRTLRAEGGEQPLYSLRKLPELGARLEKLYFEGPSREDWPALAVVGEAVFPALTENEVIVLEPAA